MPFSGQPEDLVPCQARPDASCLSFCPPAALRLRLHSDAMRPQLRLAGRQNYFVILRHFLLDKTLVDTAVFLASDNSDYVTGQIINLMAEAPCTHSLGTVKTYFR